jgi:23S rRNA (uracil1939-C5)-methyltransferase
VQIEIEKLVYGGDGLARVDREVVLTPFVLPGECVEVEREPKRSGIARARLEAVLTASPQRVKPECPYFGRCGGCHYQHAAYEAQVRAKSAILHETLERVGKIKQHPEIEIITGEPWQYRNRVQLHFADGRVGYREMRSRNLIAIDHCPISSPKLNEAIVKLSRLVRERRWPAFVETIELFTNEREIQLNVLETRQPVAQRFFDWVTREIDGITPGAIEYDGLRVSYGSFFQVNRYLISALVDAVVGDARGGHALDLYAGVGLFSLPLAERFAKVVAVESGSGAVRDLRANADRVRAPSEGEIEAHVENVDVFLAGYEGRPDLVVADPPRTGLGVHVATRLSEIKAAQIVLVACDPSTLARDAAVLLQSGYALDKLVLIDLFPQTFHIETIARFRPLGG